MKYSGLIKNDMSAAPGISVTFFTQGCPHRCAHCHNPETWDFKGGKEFTVDTLNEIYDALGANDIKRNFCIMGGEPLCEENEFLVHMILLNVKEHFPDTKIYIWTGYYYEDLKSRKETKIGKILDMTDVLIDGPYVHELRDLTLPMRGSSNQSIINLKEDING